MSMEIAPRPPPTGQIVIVGSLISWMGGGVQPAAVRHPLRTESVMIGCTDLSYMVAPVSPPMYERLSAAASLRGVPLDHVVPSPPEARP